MSLYCPNSLRARCACIGLLAAATAFGQAAFEHLATNSDGSVLYFSSSLRLKGTDQHPYPKIFTWTRVGGVRLHAQLEGASLSPGAGWSRWSSREAYRLAAPAVSADGNTVAFTGTRDCNWGTACVYSVERYEATIQAGATAPTVEPGAVSLSPNGRYALLVSSLMAPGAQRARLLDLHTGQQTGVEGLSAGFPFRRLVANDGTVLAMYPSPGLWRAGERRTLATTASARAALINAAATRIVYSEWPLPGAALPRLFLHDIQTGRETELATVTPASSFVISDDASVIAYVDGGIAWVVRHDGSGRRRVTEVPDYLVEPALSGDGRVLFAITASNGIVRVDLSEGGGQVIVPATPATVSASAAGWPLTRDVVPGGLYGVTGEALPVVRQVRLFGRSIPALWSSSTATRFQIPWEFPADNSAGWIELDLPDSIESQFDSTYILSFPIWIRPVVPTWFLRGTEVLAAHQDFSGLVTAASPAQPGEIVHLYATGFGPVTSRPASGEATPLEPLSVLTEPAACELGQTGIFQPLEVLFAGLAPGMIGVYQVDLRLPRVLSQEQGRIHCGVPKASAYTAIGDLPLSPGTR